MSDHSNQTLHAEQPQGQEMAVAPSYTWTDQHIPANSWLGFNISAYFNIIGVGINTHGPNRVLSIESYPDGDHWWLNLYNDEDHEVTLDVTAWHS